MKVSLVVAPMFFRRCPLIGLGYLVSSLRANGHQVSALDLNTATPLPHDGDESIWQDPDFILRYIEGNQDMLCGWVDKILAGDPGLVGFSLWNSNKQLTFALAAMVKLRKPGCLLVFGGPHISFETERLLRQCPAADLLVHGEGERTLLEIIGLYEKHGKVEGCPGTYFRRDGGIVTAGPRPAIADLDSIPFPDYHDFQLDKYYMRTALPLSFNRGCIRRCEFCNIHVDWPAYSHRSAGNIFLEIERQLRDYPGVDHFLIDSSALNQDVRQLNALCDLIIAGGLKFAWGGMAMFRPEMTPELLRKMAAAGCRDLSYGLEFGSQKLLDRMKKGFLIGQAAQCVRNTREAGIEVSLNLIIGAPDETEEDLRATMDFLKANRRHISFVGHPSELSLTTGIPMQRQPEKFGITPGPAASGTTWVSGENTHELRQARIRKFNEFLAAEDIGEFTPQSRLRTLTDH